MTVDYRVVIAVIAVILIAGAGYVYFMASPPVDQTNKTNFGGCPGARSPVCGSDGRTYDNDCLARLANKSVQYSGECQADSCSETDYGRDVLVKGTTAKGQAGKTDSCVDSNSVLEYYCSNNAIKNETIACPNGTVCSEGACVNQTSSSCTDTDNGLNYFVKGTVKLNGTNYDDVCSNPGTVLEYSCQNGRVNSTTYNCPTNFVCQEGRCVELGPVPPANTSQTCSDSDGGIDYGTAGVVTSPSGTGTDTCSGNTLVEYYCDGNTLSHNTHDCNGGQSCSNGRCVVSSSCIDTDHGEDLTARGTVTAPSGTPGTDFCVSPRVVREYSCAGGSAANHDYTCPAGKSCDTGACVPTASAVSCTDSDGGQVYGTRGTTQVTRAGVVLDSQTDSCASGFSLNEYYCSADGSMILSGAGAVDCSPGLVCRDGACVAPASPAPYCTDPDAGAGSEFIGSSVTGYGPGGSYEYVDGCAGRNVKEYYCDGTNYGENEISCPYGQPCQIGTDGTGACRTGCDRIGDASYSQMISGTTYVGGSIYYDSCTGDLGSTLQTVCAPDGTPFTETVNCPTGYTCSPSAGGVCAAICTDFDGTTGDVATQSRYRSYATYGASTYYDTCIDTGKIREYTCGDSSSAPIGNLLNCNDMGLGCISTDSGAYCG